MPFKISFGTTWLSWLSHYMYYCSNKERKQINRLEVCVAFCLVIFLFNQINKQCVQLEPRTFSTACWLRGQGLELRGQGQGLPKCVFEAEDVFEDSTSAVFCQFLSIFASPSKRIRFFVGIFISPYPQYVDIDKNFVQKFRVFRNKISKHMVANGTESNRLFIFVNK